MNLLSILLFAAICLSGSGLVAQETPVADLSHPTSLGQVIDFNRNVFFEVQIVDVPLNLALPIAGEMMDVTRIDAAHAKLQELIAKGTAKLVGWPMFTTKSGQVAAIESISEICYITNYEPGAVNFF